jgi:hypothetical protein
MANFLNLRCPRCDRDDGIDIQATVWVRVLADGTDADASEHGDHDYTPRSRTVCAHCSYAARLADFQAKPARGAP